MTTTHENLRQSFLAHRRERGKDSAFKILQNVGGSGDIDEIPESKYAAVIAALSADLMMFEAGGDATRASFMRAERPKTLGTIADRIYEKGQPKSAPLTQEELHKLAWAKFNSAGRNKRAERQS